VTRDVVVKSIKNVLVLLAWVAVFVRPCPAAAAQLASKDDAVVNSVDTGWVLGNSLITYAIGFDSNGDLIVQDLRRAGDTRTWRPSPTRDTLFRIGDRDIGLTRSDATGFRHVNQEVVDTGAGLELRLTFEDLRDGLRARRIYAIYPQMPLIEAWTELESMLGRSTTVSDMAPMQLTVDGTGVTTVDGLSGPAETGGAFALQRHVVTDSEPVVMEEGGRSTQRYLPFATVSSARGTLFVGLMWSGAWRMDLIARPGTRTEVTAWLSTTSTTVTPTRSVSMPHALVGVVGGDEGQVAPALHRYIVSVLRGGRPLEPLATYNTWFSTGTDIDEELIEKEMEEAAAAGAELFELDAGWYEGAGELDAFDFTSGLGSWRVDTDKFPHGLRALADRAHGLGMRFSLWVEPERVDLRTVGEPGMARETWLQQENGHYEIGVPNEEARTAMLDLGNPEARAWLLEKLSVLIIESGVDHLKWDNNAWITNTRPLAGAGPNDGNFRHVSGLYELLAALRERFPWLLIENCSGGGNRLDLGMLRYTDAGWMDDRTSPSAHVRHNLQGLTLFLPPAYLLSYLIHDANEPMHDAADFALYARSRMPGVFGMSFPPETLDERDMERLRAETDRWKALRSVQNTASAVLVSPQVDGTQSGPWDATLLVSPGMEAAVLYAFQNDLEVEGVNLRMRGLDRTFTYVVSSDREGEIGAFTGAALMDDGIDLYTAESTRAHLLTFTRLSREDAAARARRLLTSR
jgi:alpha-galactosidase